jgi:hypothetical protein
MAIRASVLLTLQVLQNPESVEKKVKYTSHNHFNQFRQFNANILLASEHILATSCAIV